MMMKTHRLTTAQLRVLPVLTAEEEREALALLARLRLQGKSVIARLEILHDWGRSDRAGKDRLIEASWTGL